MGRASIDTDKISKEMTDVIKHRACVMRSGEYLSNYLIHQNRSVDAIRLLGRCAIHDISKMQDTDEFMSLASIIDQMDAMHDTSHVLSESQKDAIKLHWIHNSHHPEHYDSPNDMSDLDLLEMACDCHARSKQYQTDLIEYITKQQDLRFHFDGSHFHRLLKYCTVLVEMTKEDSYGFILNSDEDIRFDFKDSTLSMLEEYDDSCYEEYIYTDRLYLKKKSTTDFASVLYIIRLKENNQVIGYITLNFNGTMEYKIYENFLGQSYGEEALSKFVETSTFNEITVRVNKDNISSMEMLERLGFVRTTNNNSSINFVHTKSFKALKKKQN